MKKWHIVGLILIAASMVAIFVMSGDYTSYETFDTAISDKGREFHVVGVLVRHEEMHYDPIEDPNVFSFYMQDEDGTTQKVIYHDPKPQDFERSEKIVVTGRMLDEHFEASNILLKCPSKYVDESLEIQEARL